MKNILSLALVLILWTTCYGQKQKLELNLVKGETYVLNLISNATVEQHFGDQTVAMKMSISGKMAYKVTEIQDSIYAMEVCYKRLAMKMALPAGEMEFSSEKKDENDIMSTFLGGMINKSFITMMTKSGKITEIRNIESLFTGILDKFPQLSEAQKQQIMAQIRQAYGENALKGNLSMVSAIFSDEPVAAGDKWTVKTKMESGMAVDVETVYELKEIHDTSCIISGDSRLVTVDKDAYVESNGMSLRYDMNGTMLSNLKINKNSGWIINATISQNIRGTIKVKENPQMPDGMTYTMTMQNEMTVTD